MTDYLHPKSPFLQKVVAVIQENISDEAFGVTELAEAVHMSRSNLLRKIKQETGVSVSVFIRNVKLQQANELLKKKELTVSEISYKVGFGSTSYFTKCFRELYGKTPGELLNESEQAEEKSSEAIVKNPEKKNSFKYYAFFGFLLIIPAAALAIYFFYKPTSRTKIQLSKSLAVLPFKNDSPDSSNIYFMNGLREAILDNFQKIEDLKVTSRTTVEQYRNISKSIPELSEELGVSYFIEGSGQKMGNEIVLTIQLIEAPSDKHLWSKRYKRELKDIFELQADVAKSIAAEINAIITPEEQERIEKIPTNNLVAYDYYLKGLSLLNDETGEGLEEGIIQFKKAIQEDAQFANAYAYIAVSYYYLDVFQQQKQHTELLKQYADKAMELEPEMGESLIAHALYFMQIKEYQKAVETFEKVLAYYPNIAWIHNFMSDIYAYVMPDTEKYLKHALQGIQVAAAGNDSIATSITYLHLSNALVQTGFLDEAEKYVKKSLAYNPKNHYSQYLQVYIKLGQDFDLEETKASLIKIYEQDTNKLDVIQEVAKVCYTLEDYEEAWQYYQKLVDIRESLHLDIYHSEDIKIAYVLEQVGKTAEAQSFYDSYLAYAENDQSIYKTLSLSAYYASKGAIEKGMEYLKAFTQYDSFQYWFVLFLDKDPVILQMQSHPDFQATIQKIKANFWAKHEELEKELGEKGLL
jgi:TolB-like protein/AraC-like DNA-binding protein/Tfp pilus assembly protein PilF